MINYSFKLGGIECLACVKLAKKDIEKIPGVHELNIQDSGEGHLRSDHKLDKNQINKLYLKNNYFIEELYEN